MCTDALEYSEHSAIGHNCALGHSGMIEEMKMLLGLKIANLGVLQIKMLIELKKNITSKSNKKYLPQPLALFLNVPMQMNDLFIKYNMLQNSLLHQSWYFQKHL